MRKEFCIVNGSHSVGLPMAASRAQLLKFLALVAAALVAAAGPLTHLVAFGYSTGEQSYILLVPAIVAFLLYRDRRDFFAGSPVTSRGLVIAAFVAGLALITVAWLSPSTSELQLAATALGLVALWTAAFSLCFGEQATRAAAFPLGMLLWMVPMPAVVIDAVTRFLQVGSAEFVSMIFSLTGVPVLREGFVFQLPGQAIEVAKECSGIRSSLCMALLFMIVAHDSLRSNVRRAVLLFLIIPVVILKNAVR